jgi:hypothetical protein
MSYSLSLEKSIRTCDVNVGEANRIQSDRFFNPQNMVCIPWNGYNNKGQVVSPDSWYTKTPGCDSAEDRVLVENMQRPQYMSYVTLGAQGIAGDFYGNYDAKKNSIGRTGFDYSRNKLTGNFGTDFGAKVAYQSCSIGAYESAMAQMNQAQAGQAALNNKYMSQNARQMAGAY